MDLEQDPKFPKAIVKKRKYEFGQKLQDVVGNVITMGKIYGDGNKQVTFVRCKVCFTVEG